MSRVCLLALVPALFAAGVRVEVKDATGAALPDAQVTIRTMQGSTVAQGFAGGDGAFEAPDIPTGSYSVHVEARGMRPVDAVAGAGPLQLTLHPDAVHMSVTVTADRAGAAEVSESARFVSVVPARDNLPQPTAVHSLQGVPGVLLQETTYGQASPFLRGFTGYHVLHLIDGVRFNNATFRAGPNQYMAYLEPAQASRLEVVLGPSGSEFGSDSLGGSIHVLTPSLSVPGALDTHGALNLFGSTADRSGGASANIQVSRPSFAWLLGGTLHRFGDLRPGRGVDSHNVFTRLLGLPGRDVRELLGSRLRDTDFARQAIHAKMLVRLPANQLLSFWLQHAQLSGVDNYKDTFGGLGHVESAVTPQRLWFGYLRYEKLGLGPLASLAATGSWNHQQDGSRRRALRFTGPQTEDAVALDSYGYSAQAAARPSGELQVAFGGELYDEHVGSTRLSGLQEVRPLYPAGARYATTGLFGQGALDLWSRRLRLSGGARFTAVRFRSAEDARFGVAASQQWFRDVAFHSSALLRLSDSLAFTAMAGRGFRAPNLNDLGALGLNDLGYEVPASEAAGALLAASAAENALPAGRPIRGLSPESLFNYEAGLRWKSRRLYVRSHFFDAELFDPIVRRTLLFPASGAPSSLAGVPVLVNTPTPAQAAAGVVTVSPAFDARAVKAFVNDGRARYVGVDSTVEFAVSSHLSFRGAHSYIAGRELNPNRNHRRLPPQTGRAVVAYRKSRWWMESRLTFAGRQDRLSGGDLDDERIGAARSRNDIAQFFAGDLIAPWRSGQVFTPTGETVRQIQDRLLPGLGGSLRVALYTATPGWASVDLLGGVSVGERTQVTAAVLNVFDRNYRVHGSGIDAPGAGLSVALSHWF